VRTTYWIIGLCILLVVVSIFVGYDPEHSERLSEMRRGVTLTGEARTYAIWAAAFGIGAFVIYLTMTRR